MALPNEHSYTAKPLQAQIASGKYKKLRWFQYQGMGGSKPSQSDLGQAGSYTPMWARQTGAKTYQAPGTETRTWFNATYGAAFPAKSPKDSTGDPFFTFSATCIEFGRNLLDMLGEDAPPIGLIQSAVSSTA